jgi:hypothetical protein
VKLLGVGILDVQYPLVHVLSKAYLNNSKRCPYDQYHVDYSHPINFIDEGVVLFGMVDCSEAKHNYNWQ